MKVLPMESELNPSSVRTDSLVNADKSMRYGIAIAGMISGELLTTKSKILRLFSLLYQVLVVIILAANFLAAAIIVCTDQREADFFSLFVRLSFLLFIGEVTVSTLIIFINTSNKSRLIGYYKQLSEVEQLLESLGIKLQQKRFVRASVLATTVGWLITILYFASKVYDLAANDTQDVFYDTHLLKRLNSTSIYQGLKTIGVVSIMYSGCDASLGASQFFVMCFIISTLTAEFNKKYQQDVNASPNNVLSNINQYRVVHLALCDLVSKANECFSAILAVKLGAEVLVLLLVFYLLSLIVANPGETEALTILAIWIVIAGSIIIIYIVMAERVSNEVRAVVNTIN